MSRRGKHGRDARYRKYSPLSYRSSSWDDSSWGGEVVVVGRASDRPDRVVASPASPPPSHVFSATERRVLAVLAKTTPWAGDSTEGGTTTGEVASQLRINPRTNARAGMESALTTLRRAGFVHYEYDRVLDREVRWWITEEGVRAAARALA